MKYPTLTFFQFIYLATLIFAAAFVFNSETRNFGYAVYIFLGIVSILRFFILTGLYD